MWAVWMMFFFQYAAVGAYYTFLNVYFRTAGMSGTQIGLLNMITALIGVGGSMVWGYVSDLTGKPRLLIAIGAAGSLLASQFIPYIQGFWLFLLFGCLGSLMNSAPGTLVDSTTLVLLGKKREDYGQFRLGGSIGYIITAFASGFIYQQAGLKVMFPAYGILMGCFALTALLIPPVTLHLEKRDFKDIGQMTRQVSWIIFIITVFLSWIAANAAISFLSVSMNAMGASQSLIGEASTIQAVVEMPFMFFSGRFLRRYGPIPLLIVSMILSIIRYFLLGWMPSPAWAIAINVLNGPAYVFFWNSAVNYANKMAPKGMAGTAQGLVNSTTGLAGMISSILSGWLFDRLGPNGIFTVMAFLVLAALILFTIGNMIRKPGENAGQTMDIKL